MPYPMPGGLRLRDLMKHAEGHGAELRWKDIKSPHGPTRMRWFRRGNRGAPLPDLPDDEIVLVNVICSVCRRLAIPMPAGFELFRDLDPDLN